MFDNKGHWIDDPLEVINANLDFSGLGMNPIFQSNRKTKNITMEEWQDPDSGYLNCIGVGDTYVRKQMERILGSGDFNAPIITRKFTCAMGEE